MTCDNDGNHLTAAVLTPRGRGAVATIRLSGDAAATSASPSFRAVDGRELSQQPIGRVVFGRWGEGPSEEVVLRRCDARTVEVHCHGGDAAVARILDDLASRGCRVVNWTEQLPARRGLLETECLEALSRATTQRTADILLDQYSGTLRSAIERIRATPPLRRGGQGGARHMPPELSSDAVLSGNAAIDDLLAWAEFGLHLTAPWRVVIAGRPNAGKSSLINALLGYTRSIVFDQPGTTRDVVTAQAAFQGWPVLLTDTAGIRGTAGGIEAAGIAKAREELAHADCRVIVLDVSRPGGPEESELLRDWPEALVIAHKSDLPDVRGHSTPADALRVSSLTGDGVDVLAAAIAARLVPGVPAPGTPVPVSPRQVRLLQQVRAALAAGDLVAAQSGWLELLEGPLPHV